MAAMPDVGVDADFQLEQWLAEVLQTYRHRPAAQSQRGDAQHR
jgi:hypothetical protein